MYQNPRVKKYHKWNKVYKYNLEYTDQNQQYPEWNEVYKSESIIYINIKQQYLLSIQKQHQH